MVRKTRVRYVIYAVCMLALALVIAACQQQSRPTLTVTKAGTGSGAVTGTDIDCGDDCTSSYATGTSVILTATPDTNSTFSGWSGDCSGETCELTMDSNKAVTATFDAVPPPPQGKALSGTAEDWTGRDAVVRAETYTDNGDYLVVATSPVAENGAFSVSLPGAEGIGDAASAFNADDASCEIEDGTATGSIEVTPSQFDFGGVNLYVYPSELPEDNNEDYLGFISQENDDGSVAVQQMYVSIEVSIQGSCTAAYTYEDSETGEAVDVTDNVTYDLNLEPGWNDVVITFDDSQAEENIYSFAVSTGTVPAGLTWKYYEELICEPGDETCEETPPVVCEDSSELGCESVGALSTKPTLGRLLTPRSYR